jgi:nitrogen regulatory protein P-II 1
MTKKIEAIVRKERVNEVKEALRKIGIIGFNVIEISGHGRSGEISIEGSAGVYQVDLLLAPRIQFNIVLSDHNVEKAIQTIMEAVPPGNKGDGLLFVYPVEEVIRLSTGERGHEALMYKDDIDTRHPSATA